VSVEEEDLVQPKQGPVDCGSLGEGACLLIPLSLRLGGGVLVAAEQCISHFGVLGSTVQCTFDLVYFTCWASVGSDDCRFLLGDQNGNLYLLLINHNDAGEVVSLSRQPVGVTTTASSLSYLDSGVCFIGSRHANSQLVKLLSEPVEPSAPNNYVQVWGCKDAR
jgi:DNA damage-binding protein 1